MLKDIAELVGALLIVAFFAVVFWPLALLSSGILLIVLANLPPERTAPPVAGPAE